jgi:hypothetical protein
MRQRMKILPLAFDEGPQLSKVRQRLGCQFFLPISRDMLVGNHREETGQFIELIRDMLK